MTGFASTIWAANLDKAVIFPSPLRQPNWRRCSAYCETYRRCDVTRSSNIPGTKYLGCLFNSVNIRVNLQSYTDRRVFRVPKECSINSRTSRVPDYLLTRSLWRNDAAGHDDVCSTASWCDTAKVLDVITRQRGKHHWSRSERPTDRPSTSVGILT